MQLTNQVSQLVTITNSDNFINTYVMLSIFLLVSSFVNFFEMNKRQLNIISVAHPEISLQLIA